MCCAHAARKPPGCRCQHPQIIWNSQVYVHYKHTACPKAKMAWRTCAIEGWKSDLNETAPVRCMGCGASTKDPFINLEVLIEVWPQKEPLMDWHTWSDNARTTFAPYATADGPFDFGGASTSTRDQAPSASNEVQMTETGQSTPTQGQASSSVPSNDQSATSAPPFGKTYEPAAEVPPPPGCPLGPATDQKIRYEDFYQRPTQDAEFIRRRQTAEQDDGHIQQPLTYETCQDFIRRQKKLRRDVADPLILFGEYLIFLYTGQNRPWGPPYGIFNDMEKMLRLGIDCSIPVDHVWIDKHGHLNVPRAWLTWRPSITTSRCDRNLAVHRYMIAYSVAYHVSQPLPYEHRELYFDRRRKQSPVPSETQIGVDLASWLAQPDAQPVRPFTGTEGENAKFMIDTARREAASNFGWAS